jgi:fatty acid desaturase
MIDLNIISRVVLRRPLIIHPADRRNVVRAFCAPIVCFFPYFVSFPGVAEYVYAVVMFLFIGKTNYILHLHIHRPFSTNALLNLALDLSMGSVTGMTGSNWRIQHRYGHHRGLDEPYRGRAWELERYSVLRALSYSVRSIAPTLCSPYAEAFRKGVLRNVRSPINYRWAFCEQTLLLLFVLLLLLLQPRLTLSYLLPIYMLTFFISRYVDYLNHYGCSDREANPFERANNSLHRSFNSSTHNFGYHTAHHLRPSAHWTELPAIHEQIAHHIPGRCLKSFSWSFLLLPYHFVRSRRCQM